MKKVLILAGGTGGHVIPALEVANELRGKGAEVVWLGTQKGLENTLVPAAGIKLCYVMIQGVRGKGILSLLAAPLRIFKATWQAVKIIREENPHTIIGFGGFVAGPGGMAAWLLRKPLIIHEQNAVAGLTNRALARLATHVFQAFPDTFPANVRPITAGNPVRASILNLSPPETRFHARAQQDRPNVLIIGGSLGAKVFNDTLPEVFATFSAEQRPYIWHSAGKHEVDAVKARYVNAHIEANVMPFIEDMPAAYAWADLVICRAGALTVFELAAAGVGSVLIPYPYAVDDHQTKNAAWLVNVGAGRLIQQKDFTIEAATVVLRSLLSDKHQLLEMAKAARSLALPEAVKIICALVSNTKKNTQTTAK